ncbi:MAG: hypothetical protein ABIU54_06865 [Candidatus Eisenbacteria bacterium]
MSHTRSEPKRRHEHRDARRERAQRPAAPPWLADMLMLGGPALAALYVHLAALVGFYSPDDLILLERVRGIAPFPDTLWRFVSGRLYWVALFPMLGPDPFAWHALSLVLHAAATVLVGLFARRLGASRATAFLTALLFGATAQARTVVWQISGAGETLALLALLGALIVLVSRRSTPSIGAASALHAAGMLCKETIGLAPLALVFARTPEGARRVSWRALGVPLAVTVALVAYLSATRSGTGSLGGEAYAFGFGRHVLDHLLTYAIWSTDLMHVFAGLRSPLPSPWALAAAALITGLTVYAWRSGSVPARVGLALWLLLLLPVLPLKNAVYPHYVYAARAGWSLALVSALFALVRGLAPTRAGVATDRPSAWITAALVAVLHTVTAVLYLTAMQSARMPGNNLPRDTFLRKMEVARNAALGLKGQLPLGPTRLVVYAPPGETVLFSVQTGRTASGAEANEPRYTLINAVLDQGRGLRALYPQLTDVRFDEHVAPADVGAQIAVNSSGGHIVACGTGPEAHARAAALWSERGATQAARTHLEEALQLYPGSAVLVEARDALAP